MCHSAILKIGKVNKKQQKGYFDAHFACFYPTLSATELASLWSVDSNATAELMTEFYSSLGAGLSPERALWKAQQLVRQHSGWDHPYYWAAFQLYETISDHT